MVSSSSTALLQQLPGLERMIAPPISVGASATQICLIPWTAPANANGWLEKLVISNQNVSNATLNIWDADITSSGTVPTARGSNTAPLIPTFNIAAGTQVYLGYDLCPNIDIQAGLVGQASQTTVWVQAQIVIQVG